MTLAGVPKVSVVEIRTLGGRASYHECSLEALKTLPFSGVLGIGNTHYSNTTDAEHEQRYNQPSTFFPHENFTANAERA